ncbi:MAG TPA: hypothetical protein VK066_32000 [Chloroflexota bacterium]|nr:hypothetical protein [Chloroflexota bacterium]
MRRLLYLLVVLGITLTLMTAFAVPVASAAELASLGAPAAELGGLGAPAASGTHALLPPGGDPSWFWWWGAPPAAWTCTWSWPSYCAGPSVVAPWIPSLGIIW